jgi:V/A-type H+-transporting ATPase subunit A
MEFYRRAASCIKLGAPLYRIMSLTAEGEGNGIDLSGEAALSAEAAQTTEAARPIRERLARLKSEVKNDDTKAFAAFEREMIGALERLERSYRNKELL